MHHERRTETRVEVKLPLRLASGETGITRDISSRGLFFELDDECTLADEIDLSVGLSLHGQTVWQEKQYKVIRVVRDQGRMGVAVQLLN